MTRVPISVVKFNRDAAVLYAQAADHLDDVLMLAAAYSQCSHNTGLLEAFLVVELNAADLDPGDYDLRYQWAMRPASTRVVIRPPPPASITILALYQVRYLPSSQSVGVALWAPIGWAVKDTLASFDESNLLITSPRADFQRALATWSSRMVAQPPRRGAIEIGDLEAMAIPSCQTYQRLDPRSADDSTRHLTVQPLSLPQPSCTYSYHPITVTRSLLIADHYPRATGAIDRDRIAMQGAPPQPPPYTAPTPPADDTVEALGDGSYRVSLIVSAGQEQETPPPLILQRDVSQDSQNL